MIKPGTDEGGFKTKLGLAKELIRKAVDRNVPFSCVVFDAWYFNHDMTSFLEALGKDWVLLARETRRILVVRRKVQLSKWAAGLQRELFRPMKLGRTVHNFVRNHRKLNGKNPAEMARIKLELGKNRLAGLIRLCIAQ